MRVYQCSAFALLSVVALSTPALAQNNPFGQPQTAPPAPPPAGNGGTWQQPGQPGAPAAAPPAASAEEQKKPKQPKMGDFNAGGQVRLPSGPDEMGEYATFNWVAVDAKGKYYLLDSVTLDASAPIALIHPDTVAGGAEPGYFGGLAVTFNAKLPQGPMAGMMKYKTDVSLLLTGGYMKEGAMLLSEKDFPMFIGSFHPGFSGGLSMKIKLSSLVDFSLVPVWVYQGGEVENQQAVQIPMSLILSVGSLVKLSADLGVFTGDDYSFGADNGGRIYAGGALDIKIGKLIFHGGAGTASLLTGGLYPTVRDAFYLDLNVAFAK